MVTVPVVEVVVVDGPGPLVWTVSTDVPLTGMITGVGVGFTVIPPLVVGLADVCGWLLSLLPTNPSLGGAGDPSASDGPPAPPEPARAG